MYRYVKYVASRIIEHVQKSDEAIIDQIHIGESHGFGVLYTRYLDAIYRFIYFRVGRIQEEAEDLTEVVFVKAFTNIRTYKKKETGSFRAWLYQIARNSIVDYYRTVKKHQQVQTHRDIGADMRLGEDIERQQELEQLQRGLTTLTGIQQEVVILHFIEGYSYEEMSKILHKKEDALRAIQYRALKELRRRLSSTKKHGDIK